MRILALMGLYYCVEHDHEAREDKQMPAVPQPISPVRAAIAPASRPSNPSQLAKQAERVQALHKAAQIIQSRGKDLHSPNQISEMSRWQLLPCTYQPLQTGASSDSEGHPCSDLMVVMADAVQEISWATQEV